MASAPSDPPIAGRVGRDGRLVSAGAELAALQVEAGAAVGESLALPQLAGLVRVAQRLKIPVSRQVVVAGSDRDLEMWVRAVPDGEDIALTIERWTARPAAPPRLTAVAMVEKPGSGPLSLALDPQLRVAKIAPALVALLGLDPGSTAGQPVTRMFRLEEDEGGDIPLISALASRSAFSGQRVTGRSSGIELTLEGQPSVDGSGAFAGFDLVAEKAGDEASDVPSRPMIDGAIHSALRSPLDTIVRTAEAMVERTGGEPVSGDYESYASDIAAAARHLLSVIRSLDQRVKAPETAPVSLAELASKASALLETAAVEREIVVAIQPGQSVAARGEPRSIVQIVVNLLANAIRHSDEGTAVTISFEADNGSALLHVADEGPGIPEADRERIFEPFQQGNGGGEGSGLGLSIARRLARSMGGEIVLESAPGSGARFTLVLPAA